MALLAPLLLALGLNKQDLFCKFLGFLNRDNQEMLLGSLVMSSLMSLNISNFESVLIL